MKEICWYISFEANAFVHLHKIIVNWLKTIYYKYQHKKG
jgi:hypothetical protein